MTGGVTVQDSPKHLLLRAYGSVKKWHRAIQDAKHRPMRNCSEQVLNSYPEDSFMIKALYAPMEEMEAFVQIRRRMQKKAGQGMILAGGCIDSQKAHLIGCLARDYPVTCIIAPDDLRAKEIHENYRIFDPNVLLYPARDFLFFQADLQSRTLTTQRVRCMKALADITSGLYEGI